MKMKTSSSHEEGVKRYWSISTKEFLGDENGNLKGLVTCEVEWIYKKGEKPTLNIIPGTEKTWPCELALLALGFTGPGTSIVDQLGLETDFRTNIKASTSDYKTNIPGVFAAGDIRRGQSLIVWAISEGRQAAYHIDKHLMGDSNLPLKDDNDLPRL
jgi:glutamate synthase (NADPH/NADH) small chain